MNLKLKWRLAKHQTEPLPHIAMVMANGEVRFGKYSEVNHVFLAWNGEHYDAVYPLHIADLGSVNRP